MILLWMAASDLKAEVLLPLLIKLLRLIANTFLAGASSAMAKLTVGGQYENKQTQEVIGNRIRQNKKVV